MTEPPNLKLPDPVELSQAMARIAEQGQKLVGDFLARQPGAQISTNPDPLGLGTAFLDLATRFMADPMKLAQAQANLWGDYLSLWQTTAQRLLGETPQPLTTPARDDRRFKDPAWTEDALFDFIKQSYLVSARWLQGQVHDVDGLDAHTQQKLNFYTRQFVDALAPSNFLVTNPEVLRETMASGGENLVKGLENLLKDLERGRGQLQISMTDESKFKVGGNVATTPGKVIYQNELMQLLQYEPTTKEVYRRPLLVIPPWINKFYILDLKAENSAVRWWVEQGHTIFVISWVNPDQSLADMSFEDYMTLGPLAALDAIEQATGEREVNAVGYCLGGTLLASTLAYMAAKQDERIKSALYLVTMVDFAEPGDLGVFIDEEQLATLEAQMAQTGYLEASAMGTTFNMLRANDLIWSFVVNNYLLGKDPFPFDLLYWNSDSTRMPCAMHSFYLRNMYQQNKLIQPGGITLKGVPIDLKRITVPTYLLSTREDHIAPWKSTYAATQIYQGPVRFVLAASGHIAGVINPPGGKYSHFTNDKLPPTPDEWLAGAAQVPGSWWPDYAAWVAPYGGGKVTARKPGDGKLKPIEDAPGSYVRVRAVGGSE